MKVLNTVIQVKKVSIINNDLKGNFQMAPIYTKQIEKIDDKTYILTLNFATLNTPDKPFPVDINVSIAGTFTFDSDTNETHMENFIQIPAVQILFPHLRSLISSVTASCYLQPLLLPLVDARIFTNT